MNHWREFDPIDAHTHLQPDVRAGAAFFRRIGLEGDGLGASFEYGRFHARELGVTRQLIVPWLPAQKMVEERARWTGDRDSAVQEVLGDWADLNHWAASAATADPERVWALVGLDPVLMDEETLTAQVDEALGIGATGLKVAPQWLGIRPDDPAMEIVWQLARRHSVPVLSESGAYRFGHALPWGHPRYFRDVLASYPDVTIVLAHLGMGAEDDLVRLTTKFENVYTDTALRLPAAGNASELRDTACLIRRIGVDRVLFGTNTPVGDLQAALESLAALPLNDNEKQLVAHQNALHVWGGHRSEALSNPSDQGAEYVRANQDTFAVT